MKNKKIFILIDYRNGFYSSTKYRGAYMDYKRIRRLFEKKNYSVCIENFSEVDFKSTKYNNSYILYQSSEDPDLKYKDYIEDIILGLKLKGAILIPEFKYFRAHHNKVFMEILRDISDFDDIKNISSQKFGTYEEFVKFSKQPEVIKLSLGSKSDGVFKFKNNKNLKKYISTFSLFNFKLRLKSFLDKKTFTPISNHRRKFIVQNFIKNLKGDFKVLVYGKKLYVLFRKNRKNDFRASGSGILSFIEKPSDSLLDYVEKITKYFKTPLMSLDIAFDGKQYYLIEIQFLMFGNHCIEKSKFYFEKINNTWEKIVQKSDLEKEFVNSIHNYIKNIKI